MTSPTTPAPRRDELRPHQQAAVEAGSRQLRPRHSRALITSACGTGKTLIAIRIADRLAAHRTMVVVPSLELLAQTALAWRADGHTEPMVALSSMDTDGHHTLRSARVGGTSDPVGLARALTVLPRLTVFTTYASLEKIETAQHHTGIDVPPFDLAIMDEAHRVAGRADKTWTIIHDAHRIRADRRLYLTATPRIWDNPDLTEPDPPRPRHRGPRTAPFPPHPALSMDDPATFGPHVHDYPLAQAIADGILADYRILVPTITDTHLRTALNQPPTTPDARRTTALHLAITKAITTHDLRRVLVYFNDVDTALRFTREYPHTLRALPGDQRPTPPPQVTAIHGEHTPEQRRQILTDFTRADRAILTNAKLLTEGIDIRDIDAVVFADTTRSIIRCVQALGRALRKPADTGKISHLIIPAYVPPDADPTDLLGTAYEPVWSIASALRSHDHRITERLPNRSHRLATTTRHTLAHHWHFDIDTTPDAIARAMDLIAFDPHSTRARTRRRALASLQAFHDEYGHLAVPGDYVDPYGFATGTYVKSQRDAYRRGDLDDDPAWRAELDALGMIWDTHQATWATNLATIQAFHDQSGHLAIPKGQPGGAFLAEQRSLAHRGHLDPDRAAQLHAIDPDWQLPHGADWTRKYHTVRVYLRAGHDPATLLTPDATIGTMKADSWIRRQLTTWNTLTPAQQQLLAKLHLTPEHLTSPRPPRRTFEQSAGILRRFIDLEGRLPGARESVSVDGETTMIGPWYTKTLTKKRAGQLPRQHDELMTRLFGEDWHAPRKPQREPSL